jgi:HD-like signal output (HDOD) protein/nitrogen-specific signal transduction histidine kinase
MRDASLEDRTKAVITRIERLPTPSVVAVRLLQATQSTETAVRDVVGIVSQDPAMAARVLSLCRRCHRGLSVEVDSIERAVVLLGFDELRAAALSVELTGLLGRAQDDGVGARLRRRAVLVASLARLAADRLPSLDAIEPAAAFLAGLLHDLGHLALHAAIPEALDRIAESATLGDTDFDATLRRVVGIDGPIAGERVAVRWGLPTSLRRTIGPGGHDDLIRRGGGGRLEQLVSLADVVVRRHGLGAIGRRPTEAMARELETLLGLEADALDAILPDAVELAGRSAELLGLHREPSEAVLVRTLADANAELDRMRRRYVAAMERRNPTFDSGVSGFLRSVDAVEGTSAVRRAIVDDLRRRHSGIRIAIAWRDDSEWWGGDDVAQMPLEDQDPRAWLTTRLDEEGHHDEATTVNILGGIDDELIVATSPKVEVPSDVLAAWQSVMSAAGRIESLQGRIDGAVFVKCDETEQAREEARRHAERVVAEIAAGAAHEMNNPLTVISGRAQLLRGRSADPLVEDAVEEIVAAGRRLAGIVSGLHRHAVATELHPADIDGSTLVERAAAAAQRLVRGLGRVDVIDEAGPVPLRVDVRRIVEVIVEACRNAREADDGARIRLRTSSGAVDGRWFVQVEDDGPGFGREALDHAFEPFFSLKPAGRRAGLGLAVVKRVVEAHGGTVVVGNRPEGGGRLMVSLPIRAKEMGRTAA